MKSTATRIRTAIALGIGDIAAVFAYRALSKAAAFMLPRSAEIEPTRGDFFDDCSPSIRASLSHPNALGRLLLFGVHPYATGDAVPDWFRNPLTGERFPHPERPWYAISDFDEGVGDIKAVWELSRFDWLLPFARRAVKQDAGAIASLNRWLDDWDLRNPPYRGPNWKCGQEASLRVLNLSAAALAMSATARPTPRFGAFLEAHARRISLTAAYATAQRNNHATSEAAALFVAGLWLGHFEIPSGSTFEKSGRENLERNLRCLVGESGSFSQYSVNYHRLLLDTCCIAELTRRAIGAKPLSAVAIQKLAVATDWLERLVDPTSGDAPNIGANDGARVLQTHDGPYRDFRPTVQLASALFRDTVAYTPPGAYDHALRLFRVSRPAAAAPAPRSHLADDGGFAILKRCRALVVLRYPRFRFRPSHADALHLDLWVDGLNLLRDSGTFSYSLDPGLYEYLASVRAHNTIEFDDRDQMPRLGRFLYGDWLTTSHVRLFDLNEETAYAEAGYTDRESAEHMRRVELCSTSLAVIDRIGGFDRKATLRWRLPFGDWTMLRTSSEVTLRPNFDLPGLSHAIIRSGAGMTASRIVGGWESTHYLQKAPVSVVEVSVDRPGVLESTFFLK